MKTNDKPVVLIYHDYPCTVEVTTGFESQKIVQLRDTDAGLLVASSTLYGDYLNPEADDVMFTMEADRELMRVLIADHIIASPHKQFSKGMNIVKVCKLLPWETS